MTDQFVRKDEVREAFGRNAEAYVKSIVHAQGESLQRLVSLTHPQPVWSVLDIATGAGHTAFAFAPHVAKVIATDITPEMLEQTTLGAAERGFSNVETAHADAESLPYPDASFDLVTCRIAPHHFADIHSFLREAARVLKPGGRFAVVDNIVPEGSAGAYINAFEKLRDLSHGRCLSMAEWTAGIESVGLALETGEVLRKKMPFHFWVQRHDADMKSYLLAMLELSDGEAREFLTPEISGDDVFFYLEEGLLIARKAGG